MNGETPPEPARPSVSRDDADTAQRTAEVMYANDTAAQSLGILLEEIRPGFARMRMTVRQDMLNGHTSCHGGLIFALADAAFAFLQRHGILTRKMGAYGLPQSLRISIGTGEEMERVAATIGDFMARR